MSIFIMNCRSFVDIFMTCIKKTVMIVTNLSLLCDARKSLFSTESFKNLRLK